MNFEPQKFFIGLIDLFSVWLPGALLTFVFGTLAGILQPAEMVLADWVIFLVISYLVGHFVFLIGSLLDTPVYDRLRHATPHHQIVRLAEGGRLSSRPARFFARRAFARFDGALQHAERLRDRHLESIGAGPLINAFQWCKVRLALDRPNALAEIERIEADSKFFRSFCVILGILTLWGAGTLIASAAGLWPGFPIDWWQSAGLFAAGLVVFLFALWRYAERRNKSTTQAYWLVIGMVEPESAPAPSPAADPKAPTHAGGVVLRKKGSVIQYLRVQSRESWEAEFEAKIRGETDPPREWVLPKGHIESGEPAEQTAVREVMEEAAIWARIRDDLGCFSFREGDEAVRVRFFVMEYLGRSPGRKAEGHRWLRERRPRGDVSRRPEWKPLDHLQDLPKESQEAVKAASAYLPPEKKT